MMASTVPAKSRPLHNFPLPCLWSKSNHRARRHHTAASPPPESRRIPHPTVQRPRPSPEWESRRISVSIPRPDPTAQKQPPPTPSDRKISIKIRGVLPKREEAEEEEEREREAAEELAKTWNLRPRKQKTERKNVGPLPENKTIAAASKAAEGGDKEREMKKEKFSLSLSKTEIEEDLFAMTGSKPNRRPKKRPRTVQKQLDDIFPGMWLGSITPDRYKISEARDKP